MSIPIRSKSSSNSLNTSSSSSSNFDRLSTTVIYETTSDSTESEQFKNSTSNDSISSYNNEIDRLSNNYSKSDELSIDHSKSNNLDDVKQWQDFICANYGYFQQFSSGQGYRSSSDSDGGDYERRIEARKQNQLELELKKKHHETSFDELPRPNFKGMGLKRWRHDKVILRFYCQRLVDSEEIDDNRYNVYLKPNHKFKWHVHKSSAPPETDVRRPFMELPDFYAVTNENLLEAIEHVYANIMRFAKRCLLIKKKRIFDYHSPLEEIDQ